MTDKLGYPFTPTPRAARMARREGRMSADEYDVLAEIYDRASVPLLTTGQETPSLTLAQLGAAVQWTKTDDALSKLLRRLRDTGWLSWRIEKRTRYVFRLPRPVDRSEMIPSSDGPPVPSSEGLQPSIQTGNPATSVPDRSEFGERDPW